MIYIRADGNTDIGMGHVMRCLSIAEAAADLGSRYAPVFITADGGCRGMIEDRGFSAIILGTDYKNMMSELPKLERMLDKTQDTVLVDSYQVSVEYFLRLRELAWTACLEDMGNAYPVDLLINYNIYGPDLRERYENCEDKCRMPAKLLLGADYMPLRKAFQTPAEYIVKENVENVIITTGGSDPNFAAAAFADAFLNDVFLSGEDITYHIISGPFNIYSDELKRKYGGLKNVVIHENVKDMRSLLLCSDTVVSASGSTIYEVSSLGVPMVIFYFAENQRQGAEAFGAATDIVNTGCFTDEKEAVVKRAVEALTKCVKDKKYRELLCAQERKLIDGKGSARIAERLVQKNAACLHLL